jgi:hypothetical protein
MTQTREVREFSSHFPAPEARAIMSLMLLALVLTAAPVVLPAPVVTDVEGCVRAACTGTSDLRVCKCVPTQEGQPPGITVDRRGPDADSNRHVEWDARVATGVVDDFSVVLADLDADGQLEVVVGNQAPESWFEVSVVDGKAEIVTQARAQDYGVDAVAEHAVLFTEWDHGVFVGREFSYARGRLESTRTPVLRRKPTPAFEQERASKPTSPRAWLATDVTKGQDDVPRALRTVNVMGLTRDDGVLGMHLELPGGGLASLTASAETPTPLRIGSATQKRLYPEGYTPADAEDWLSGRLVSVVLDRDAVLGPVWLDAAGAPVPVKPAPPTTR